MSDSEPLTIGEWVATTHYWCVTRCHSLLVCDSQPLTIGVWLATTHYWWVTRNHSLLVSDSQPLTIGVWLATTHCWWVTRNHSLLVCDSQPLSSTHRDSLLPSCHNNSRSPHILTVTKHISLSQCFSNLFGPPHPFQFKKILNTLPLRKMYLLKKRKKRIFFYSN